MTPLIPFINTGISLFRPGSSQILAQASTTSNNPVDIITTGFGSGLGEFLPKLLGAILIFLVGVIVAFAVAFVVRGLLRKTNIDDRIASSITGRPASDVPAAKWVGDIAFWLIILITVAAALDALDLNAVSAPINDTLGTILEYLPRLFSAGLLIALAWAIATLVKTIVTRGLERFNLDDRLAENTGVDPRENSVRIHETLGNALYWFVFLLFLPLILNALELNGLLAPVNGLIDEFLAAIPQILTALLVFAGGWLLAKVVRGIVTNLLAATGIDGIGHRMGLSRTSAGSGLSLSGLAGTVVYALILLTAGISALQELNIEAISVPAVSMLQQILDFIPLVLAAGVVLAVFYFIGNFVKDLVSSLLSSVGFDSILDSLGLPDIGGGSSTSTTTSTYQPSSGTTGLSGETTIQSPTGSYSSTTGTTGGPGSTYASTTDISDSAPGVDPTNVTPSRQSPSEVAGVVALVGVMLFGAVTATEILQLEQLTLIVRAIMEIAGQVLIGALILAIGLYVANLAYRLIKSSGARSAGMLAQITRIAILVFVGAMALGQMNVAPGIVNLAFGLLLGAVAVAIAIAFGLGGRDVANEQLKSWLNQFR